MHIKTSNGEMVQLGIGGYSCNTGTHFCGFYTSEKELEEIILSYLKEGAVAGDKQMFIYSEQRELDLAHKVRDYCSASTTGRQLTDQLEIKQAKDIYYSNGVFDPWFIDSAVKTYYEDTQSNGKTNLRVVGEMSWSLRDIPGVEYLFAYESRMNFFFNEKNIIGLCLYNIEKISAATMMNVLRTHPYTVIGGVVVQNPYYIPPNKWLEENAPQFL